jgi:hypothetical protein
MCISYPLWRSKRLFTSQLPYPPSGPFEAAGRTRNE